MTKLSKPQSFLLFIACCLMSLSAQAQIRLDLEAPNTRNLEYVPFSINVTVQNLSGNYLKFEQDDRESRLYFIFSDGQGNSLTQVPYHNVLAGTELEPGVAIKSSVPITDIAPFMMSAGSYNITAIIKHHLLPNSYQSRSIQLNVSKGFEAYKQLVGLPLLPGETKVKNRYYTVLLHETDEGSFYYLRIEDDKNVYFTHKLGPKYSMHTPEIKIDGMNNFHLLIRTEPRYYQYKVVSPRGVIFKDEEWTIADTIPSLMVDPQTGKVAINGGIPAPERVDYIRPGENKRNPGFIMPQK